MDDELDESLRETLARAAANKALTEELAARAQRMFAERAEWEKENGVSLERADAALRMLPDGLRGIADEARRQYDRQLHDDLAAALMKVRQTENAGAAPKPKRRSRNYI